MLKRTFTEEIILTPEELAEEFWDMNCLLQSKFFNRLAELVGNNGSFDFQMCNVVDDGELTKEGRQIMHTIGIYGNMY